jgi:subtilisin family serine protease
MRHLQEKSHSLLYQEFLDGDSRIKIAILDSGIDRDNIELANDTRIIHRRAFASENTDDWHDNQGHGTHLAGLLRKVAPHAEICVAKVTRVRLVGGVEMEEMEHADVARVSNMPLIYQTSSLI